MVRWLIVVDSDICDIILVVQECGEKIKEENGVVVVVHGAKREHSTVTLNSLPRISPGSLTPQPSSMRGGTCPLLPLKMQGESFFFPLSLLFISSVCVFSFFFPSFSFQSYVVCPPTDGETRSTSNLYGCRLFI